MSKQNYLLIIILLCFVCFTKSETTSLSTSSDIITIESTLQTIGNDMTTFESIATSSYQVSDSSTTLTSTDTNETENTSTNFVSITTLNIVRSPTTHPYTIATSMISTTTVASIATSISVTYRYIVQSNFSLKLGPINDTNTMINVQKLIDTSFRLTNFTITVTKIQILSIAKTVLYEQQYNMLVDILFTSSRNDCNITCIYNSTITQASNFLLPLGNGTMVNVYSDSGPLIEIEATTVILSTGEPPPGISAKLGMGLGISIIGILLIAEIIFLYRKYGISNSRYRQ